MRSHARLWNVRYWPVLLFVTAFICRCVLLWALHYQPQIQNDEVERIAKNLAAENVFGNPYAVATGPTAHCAPAYPFLLSLIVRLAGTGRMAGLIATAVNVFFAALQYALLPVLAEVLALPRAIGIAAGLAGALPFRGLAETHYETPLSGCVLVILFILTAVAMRRPEPGAWRIAGLGLAWGASYLITPVLAAIALTAWLLWTASARPTVRRWFMRTAVFFGASALAILPWTMRNYYALGGLFFVRDNLGIELRVSFHDIDPSDPDKDNKYEKAFWALHPYSSVPEAQRLREMGELAYNRLMIHETLAWCKTHPRLTVTLVARRFWTFWVLSGPQVAKQLLLAFVTLCGLLGLVRLARDRSPAAILFAGTWIGYPLIYYLLEPEARYHYPIDWTEFFLAAVAVRAWWVRRGGSTV